MSVCPVNFSLAIPTSRPSMANLREIEREKIERERGERRDVKSCLLSCRNQERKPKEKRKERKKRKEKKERKKDREKEKKKAKQGDKEVTDKEENCVCTFHL